jgi:glycosyltransferase involved in cell wall biosynthesis
MIGSTFEDYYHSKLASLKKADALLAISEHSRKEAINLFKFSPDHITNISAAIDPMFRQIHYRAEESKAILSKYDIGKPFVLYVPGGFDPRKNFSNLMDAYAKLPASIRETHQLVIGSNVQPMMREELTKKAASFGLSHSELILTGYVPDDELIALYNLCELHVFPSLYEGFGLPALEAMACGAPSIGSNSSSLPEVIGRPDALFDPLSVDSIHRKLFTALTEPDFRGSLRAHALMHAKKFSWERSAALALEKLEYEFAHS